MIHLCSEESQMNTTSQYNRKGEILALLFPAVFCLCLCGQLSAIHRSESKPFSIHLKSRYEVISSSVSASDTDDLMKVPLGRLILEPGRYFIISVFQPVRQVFLNRFSRL